MSTAMLNIQAVLFLFLSFLRGRRIKPLLILSFFAGITAIHVLTPYGRVLYDAGFLEITEGALKSGLQKSGLLVGLIYLSQFSVDSRIYFPGRLGGVVGRVFFYFERIIEFQGHISRKRPIADLDDILFRIEEHPTLEKEEGFSSTQAGGWLLLISVVAGNYALLAAGLWMNYMP